MSTLLKTWLSRPPAQKKSPERNHTLIDNTEVLEVPIHQSVNLPEQLFQLFYFFV